MYNSSLFVRDLSVFLFQEAPILWFTHSTKAAVLSCPFYGSPLYAFFLLDLENGSFFSTCGSYDLWGY